MPNAECRMQQPALLHSPSQMYRRVVRRAFHHFYREFAWTYDAVAWVVSGGLWRQWAHAARPELRGRVLELGFGPGHLQLTLASRPASAGIDASPQMAVMAARRLRRAGYTPRLARGLAQDLPFAAGSFDTVLATFPAEYILDPQAHAEIRRVLAPGGRLVVVPFAQLETSLYARLVDLAYTLTLQQPAHREQPPTPSFEIAGLPLEGHWVKVGASQVLVLVGSLAGLE